MAIIIPVDQSWSLNVCHSLVPVCSVLASIYDSHRGVGKMKKKKKAHLGTVRKEKDRPLKYQSTNSISGCTILIFLTVLKTWHILTTYTDFINDHIPYATLRSPAKSETFSWVYSICKTPTKLKGAATRNRAKALRYAQIHTQPVQHRFPSLPLLVESHLPSPDLLGRAPVPREKPSIDDLGPSEDKEKRPEVKIYTSDLSERMRYS